MGYNDIKNNKVSGGCQVPESLHSGVCLNEAVAVWMMAMRPKKSSLILHWVYLLRVNVHKAKLPVSEDLDRVSKYLEYRQALSDKLVVVRRLADSSEAKVIRQSDSSRYFSQGRYRIKGKIVKRMGGFYSCNGLMMTCTYAPEMISRAEAWSEVGVRSRAMMNKVNTWRHRQGMSKVKGIKVLELQEGTGYPHIHIGFPKLKWLAPVGKLTEWWGQAVNSVDLAYRDSFSPAGYVCKYISKMDGWSDEALAEIWANKTRLYSMSSDFYVQPLDKRIPEWSFHSTSSCTRLSIPELMLTFDSVVSDDKGLLVAGFT